MSPDGQHNKLALRPGEYGAELFVSVLSPSGCRTDEHGSLRGPRYGLHPIDTPLNRDRFFRLPLPVAMSMAVGFRRTFVRLVLATVIFPMKRRSVGFFLHRVLHLWVLPRYVSFLSSDSAYGTVA